MEEYSSPPNMELLGAVFDFFLNLTLKLCTFVYVVNVVRTIALPSPIVRNAV